MLWCHLSHWHDKDQGDVWPFFFFFPATKISEYEAVTDFLLSATEAFIMFSWLILTRALRGWSRVPSHFIDEKIEIQGMSYATDDSASVGQPQLDPAL